MKTSFWRSVIGAVVCVVGMLIAQYSIQDHRLVLLFWVLLLGLLAKITFST